MLPPHTQFRNLSNPSQNNQYQTLILALAVLASPLCSKQRKQSSPEDVLQGPTYEVISYQYIKCYILQSKVRDSTLVQAPKGIRCLEYILPFCQDSRCFSHQCVIGSVVLLSIMAKSIPKLLGSLEQF